MHFSNLGLTLVAAIASVASISAAPASSASPAPSVAPAPSSSASAPPSTATPPPGNATAPPSNATAANMKILNYALTLENLESAFYKTGLAKFNSSSFTDAGFDTQVRGRFVEIGQQEADHVSYLTSAIKSMQGGNPVPACNYTFPMNNVTQFMAVAQALENTGVSAYLGAASGLSGSSLTAAASIVTVEARHSAYLNELMNQTAFPYSFDTALSPQAVVSIASQFITSCPYNIGFTPFNHLTATLPSGNGTMVMTNFTGQDANSTSTYCQFIFGNTTSVSPRSSCTLPSNVTGYVYVVITDNNTPITLNNDTNIIAGPALLFNGIRNNGTAPSNSTMPPPGNGTMPGNGPSSS